jgi:hypothetical protein
MGQLVDNDVFNTGARLLYKLEIQPNSSSFNVACPPAGLHAPDPPLSHLDAHGFRPLCNKGLGDRPQLRSIGFENEAFARRLVGSFGTNSSILFGPNWTLR